MNKFVMKIGFCPLWHVHRKALTVTQIFIITCSDYYYLPLLGSVSDYIICLGAEEKFYKAELFKPKLGTSAGAEVM